MEANRDQALEALRRGEACLTAGDVEKGSRLIRKSLSLFPTPQAEAALKRSQEVSAARSVNEAHVTIIREVREARTYYEVLGVPRTADAKMIKKAYRKRVLRLHPDKNQEPGAKEGFERVSNAFSTLSEEESRKLYDQVGHDRFLNVEKRGGAGGRGHAGPGTRYRGEQMSSEDLFNMFFAGRRGPQGDMFTRMHFQQPRRRPQRPMTRDEAQAKIWRQMLPFLLLLFLFASSWIFSEAAAYSLRPSAGFPLKQGFDANGVRLNFYVPNGWDGAGRAQIEQEVMSAYATHFENQCRVDDRTRRHQMWRANAQEREKLKNTEPENCVKLTRVLQALKQR